MRHPILAGGLAALLLPAARGATFGDDAEYLRQHTEILILSDAEGKAKIALAPRWEGRVMTSTVAGDSGSSYGWINHKLIDSGQHQVHINAFGGEDRFWLGPEGGQFGIYFARGAKFDLEHWFVPPPLDTQAFRVVTHARNRALFRARFTVTNWSGTRFNVSVRREIRLLDAQQAWKSLGLAASKRVLLVAYQSVNTLTNAGREPWERQTGLLSIWILGMFEPSPAVTIVVPLRPSGSLDPSAGVVSDYFGVVPPERVRITGRMVFFRGDGEFRSKIGISPARSSGKLASYDPDHQVLTLVLFDQPPGVTEFVNSLWKLQRQPYAGDVANSYNDGPPGPRAEPLGPFYELESSSPAAALAPGSSITHTRTTIHLTGPESDLDTIARTVLGASLAEIRSALKSTLRP